MPAKQANALLVTVTKVESKAVEATRLEASPFEIERRTYFDLGFSQRRAVLPNLVRDGHRRVQCQEISRKRAKTI
jgi:hypothetical protein